MKPTKIRSIPTTGTRAAILLFAFLALSPRGAFAQSAGTVPRNPADAEVPDIETRIRNSGNAVPPAAIPAVPAPAPAALPSAPEAGAEPPPAVPPVTPVAEAAPEADGAPASDGLPVRDNPVSGSVRLGAGSPGSLLGDLSVRREEGALPALALDFSYSSTDGYGAEKPGTGFFDRAVSARIGAATGAAADAGAGAIAPSWFAELSLYDGTDGFQGKNPRYYALTRRDVSWSLGLDSIPLASNGLSLSVVADGSVDSVFAEGPSADGDATPPDEAAAIGEFAGYRLSPALALGFDRGPFRAELSGRYGYETARDSGETHDGSGELSLRYGFGNASLRASAGVAGDGGSGTSGDGLAFPFSVGFTWDAGSGGPSADGPTVPRKLSLSFGITRLRQSARSLAATEPFVDPAGLSVFAADWTGTLGLALGKELGAGTVVSVRADAEYRSSLPGRGTLALTDELTDAALVAVRRAERRSLATGAGASFDASSFSLGARYSGEWLDRLDRRSLHSATAVASVFDRGADRVWEATLESAFALDRAELPALSARGTVRPFPRFAITLAALDVLPLAAGEARTRNGLYAARSGELTLSATLDF